MSIWLVGTGVAMGGLAAVFGLIDFLTIERARGPTGRSHFLGNLVAVVLLLVSLLIRIGDPPAALLPWGLVISFFVVGILLVTRWMGGELADRSQIGVIEEGESESAHAPARSYAYSGDRPNPDRPTQGRPKRVSRSLNLGAAACSAGRRTGRSCHPAGNHAMACRNWTSFPIPVGAQVSSVIGGRPSYAGNTSRPRPD